ncbi:hypothetical protein ACFQT4_13530 [Pseudoduganella danionis]|uniref:hypothetical protein n=1 Tax=Pseudoduganella danionis TaxID=1890295 RepID=UPI0036060504
MDHPVKPADSAHLCQRMVFASAPSAQYGAGHGACRSAGTRHQTGGSFSHASSANPADAGAYAGLPVSQNNQVAEIINSPASAEAADMTQPAVAAVMSAHPQRHEKGLLHKNPRPASPPDQMAARVASRVPAEAGADRDAALLAALVAHGSSSRDSATMANRDIVERQASDSTQHLLQRCQQLGMIEGMLCRSRICAGRWDSDQACRQPAP